MADRRFLLAIDQGTTSSRAMLFDPDGAAHGMAQRELTQIFPTEAWVEHDPEEIWSTTLSVCREVLTGKGVSARDVAAIGITNQRETTILWDRETGRPIHNAIVWQDRRTADLCRRLTADGHAESIGRKTGLLIDPYFSATKIAWMLDNVPGAREAAEAGSLAFGTVDSFLLWRLTGGATHASDASNAARTMLFNIHDQSWDKELLDIMGVPASILPEVRDNAGAFGVVDGDLLGAEIPVTGMAGDQQAAAFGQACFTPGTIKSTYGTGCFVLVNTGATAVESQNRLLTTIAYRLDGKPAYALEGSIFVAGAAIQWLRDGLGLIASAEETESIARGIDDTGGVYLVPAFTGLGAPHWDPDARGALLGLTRGAGRAEIVRAALEAVCYQTRDLMDAIAADGATPPAALRVDGGMAQNDWLMQFLADTLNLRVERPTITETTALGAASLAGLGIGMFASTDELAERWRLDAAFTPSMEPERRNRLYAGWQEAVSRVRGSEKSG